MKIEIKNKKVFYISIVSVLLLIAAVYIFWRHTISEKGIKETIGNDYDKMANTAKKVEADKQKNVNKTYASYDKGYRDARDKAFQSKPQQPTFMYNGRKFNTITGKAIKS